MCQGLSWPRQGTCWQEAHSLMGMLALSWAGWGDQIMVGVGRCSAQSSFGEVGAVGWLVFNLGTGKTLITFFFFLMHKRQRIVIWFSPSFDRYMVIGWFYVYRGQGWKFTTLSPHIYGSIIKNEGKTNTGLLGLSQFTFHPHLYIHTYICSCTYTYRQTCICIRTHVHI